jgi:hypothetical protein
LRGQDAAGGVNAGFVFVAAFGVIGQAESDLGTGYENFYETPASEQIRKHISSVDQEYTEAQINLLQTSVTPWSNPINLSQQDLRLLKKVGVV